MRSAAGVLVLLALSAPVAVAQQSASYSLSEHSFNAAGTPRDGATASSASYRISLDSLGDGVVRAGLSSASYGMDASFALAFRPPGEVAGVRFADATTLTWNAELSAGDYNVYRDALGALTGGSYGACWQPDVAGLSVSDPDPLAAGQGWFYLVTVENRLDEEGTKGTDTTGATRGGTACP